MTPPTSASGIAAAHVAAEQAEHPGGAVSSHTTTLPGFVHNKCAGFFPMTLGSPGKRRSYTSG